MVAELVRAKRLGWNEQLSSEGELDFDPYDHDDDDLVGELVASHGFVPGVGPLTVYLVGGQEADPDTISPLTEPAVPAETAAAANAFCPTGPGGGVDPTCSPHGAGGAQGSPHPPSVPHPSDLAFVKYLPGSTNPKLMADASGKQWVVKDRPDKVPQQANEAQADALYRTVGVAVPNSGLGGTAKVSEYLPGSQTLADWRQGKSPAQVEAMHAEIAKGFAADALFANWDVIGTEDTGKEFEGGDNILIHEGKSYRVDNGGALLYRAGGTPKSSQFGETVGELSSMRDPYVNKATSQVFGKLTDSDVRGQMQDLLGKREAILGAVKDAPTRETLGKRLDYYQKQVDSGYGLPKEAAKAAESEAGSPKQGAGVPADSAGSKGGGKVEAGPGSFGSGQALVDHVSANPGSVKFTSLYLDKVKFLNPAGILPGTVYVPSKNPLQTEHLKTILPAGTKIKEVYVTTKQLVEGGAYLPPSPGKSSPPPATPTAPPETTAAPPATPVTPPIEKSTGQDIASVGKSLPEPQYREGHDTGAMITATGKKDKYPNPLREISGYQNSTSPPDPAVQDQWHATLTDAQEEAVRNWTDVSYSAMRKRIRDGKPTAEDKAFLAAQAAAPVYEGTSYRGLHGLGSEKLLKELEEIGVGNKWADGAPMSSSRSLSVAHHSFGHGDLMLIVQNKTGRSMETKSVHSHEKEIIMTKEARYRIKEVGRDVAFQAPGGHFWYKGYALLEEI